MKNVSRITLGFLLLAMNATAFAASDYYKYFLFTARGECSDMRHLDFQQAVSDNIDLGLNVQQKPLYATVRLQLSPDGKFWAQYEETSIEKVLPQDNPGAKVTQTNSQFKKSIEGLWSVNGNVLELPGLGVAVMPELEEISRPAFQLKITEPLNDPRALNAEVRVIRIFSNVGPKGASIVEYCGTK